MCLPTSGHPDEHVSPRHGGRADHEETRQAHEAGEYLNSQTYSQTYNIQLANIELLML